MSLLGIRVSWTIKSEYLNCRFSILNVSLNDDQDMINRGITVNDSSVDFFNLDCNEQYTPRVTAKVSRTERGDTGDSIFYGGT